MDGNEKVLAETYLIVTIYRSHCGESSPKHSKLLWEHGFPSLAGPSQAPQNQEILANEMSKKGG